MQPYTRGSNGKIMWVPSDMPQDARMQISMLEDWWKIQGSDPNLIRAREAAAAILTLLKVGAV
jgi:hypothetical protein